MELETHECLKFFLPRIAVALEEIAKQYSAETLKQAMQMLKGEQQ